MPELPEVEVVRRGLDRWVSGRRIESVVVFDPRSVRRHEGGAADFVGRLTGGTFAAAQRRGKYLWLPLNYDGAPAAEALVVHLGMSGQVLVKEESATREKHLKIQFALAERETLGPEATGDGFAGGQGREFISNGLASSALPGTMRFLDQRIFGGMHLAALDAELVPLTVSHIARDPLDPGFDLGAFSARLRAKRTEIKRALLDQSLISGIGNIYADEALWQAQIHYQHSTNDMSETHVRELVQAVQEVMARALAAGGTSFDSLYVNVNGSSGYFDRFLHSYGRGGQPCERCGSLIVREPFMNRSSYFCPKCQPRPRPRRGW